MEEENKDFANRYVEVEAENNNLANLYVASYQLHSTLDFTESLKIILEIVMNLIGAEEFSIMMLDEKTNELTIVAQEGMGPEARASIKMGDGIIGKVAKSGEAFYREGDPTNLKGADYTHPLVSIPLKIKEHVIGVIVIYKLLVQKQAFSNVDYELFSMLAGHAATALFSSKLYSQSERKLTTIQSFLDLLKEKNNGGLAMPDYNFLVVEDSPTMRQLISFALKRIPGSKIVEANDGIDALKSCPPRSSTSSLRTSTCRSWTV